MAAKPGSLRFVIQVLERFTEKHVKIITLDATANLIEDTPRDTGWARSNWVPSIGAESSQQGNLINPDAGDIAEARRASESGQALIATSYTLNKGKVFLTNNVPYIGRLNDGHSQQAPAGFVQAAIARAVRGAFVPGGQ